MAAEQFEPTHFRWSYSPLGKPFDGCIRNIVHNSKLYDLADPGLFRNSKVQFIIILGKEIYAVISIPDYSFKMNTIFMKKCV
jgi:hypothetical protein